MAMSLFSQRRPRGFHHEYMYSGRNKKRAHGSCCTSSDDSPAKGCGAEGGKPVKNLFVKHDNHAHRGDTSSPRGGMKVSTGLALLLIVILAVAWKLLLS